MIYTFILNIYIMYKPLNNIIISVKGWEKISDRLYIRVCIAKFITILYITKFIITNDRYNRYQISNKYQTNGEMHVNYPGLLNLVQLVIIANIASRQLAALHRYFSATGQ